MAELQPEDEMPKTKLRGIHFDTDLDAWLEDRAAIKHPRPNGRGGYVSALVREILERERRRVERRAK